MRVTLYRRRGWTDGPLPSIDLCVAAALDAVKAGVTLPWGKAKTPTEGTASVTSPVVTVDVSGEAEARVLVVENDPDAWDESPAPTDPPSASNTEPLSPPSSSEAEATLRRVISLSNFEKALREITPSSSESLGTLSELRKWNDEFGEGKREKKRNMWGKGSFGFVEKGEGQGEIKVAVSAGSTSGGGGRLSGKPS